MHRPRGNSDLVDVTLAIWNETPKAIKVSEDETSTKTWLPKSQIEFHYKSGNIIEVTMPEWLAKEKGFI